MTQIPHQQGDDGGHGGSALSKGHEDTGRVGKAVTHTRGTTTSVYGP